MEGQDGHAAFYHSLLLDKDDKVRAIALERLGMLRKITPDDVLPFLGDTSMVVKRAAMKILQCENDQGDEIKR
ncbi:MAG: hypothetical protein ACUVQ6_05565 [Dissulfurimicrobium sp.]|uniref:hypothetical protein n=1 Tax=Dissulfurimicrobium sp. TaxID=2022436 RepID=UPI00404B1E5D